MNTLPFNDGITSASFHSAMDSRMQLSLTVHDSMFPVANMVTQAGGNMQSDVKPNQVSLVSCCIVIIIVFV